MNKNWKIALVLTIALLCALSAGHAQTRSHKRGLSYNLTDEKDIEVLAPGISWFYNWGQKPDASKTDLDAHQVDFIPMVWNDEFSQKNIRDFLIANPHIKYILGFNEPNFTEQANLTPKQAAKKWHLIEEIAEEFDLKIVGPAVNYAPASGAVKDGKTTYTDPIKYLDDFFAARPESKVDYIAVHCYMNYVGGLKSYIEQFEKYGKPIWLTEYCAWEDGVTYQMQKNLLAESVLYLETNPKIYRYSWFIARTDEANERPYMQLLEHNEPKLTELGEIYVHMSSFDKEFFFQIDEEIPAQHYIDGHEWTHLERTNDTDGMINIWDFTKGKWVDYQIEVPQTGMYTINLRYASTVGTKIKVATASTTVDSDLPKTGIFPVWKNKTFDMELTEGKQTLRIEVISGNIKLNKWKFTLQASTGITDSTDEDVIAYPNPVEDILYINGAEDIRKLTICDSMGKQVLSIRDFNGELSVGHLEQGVYILTIEYTNNVQKNIKLIKK